jgi:hypothetical protein
MKILLHLFIFILAAMGGATQVAEPVTTLMEQQLENLAENNNDNETEDDSGLQQLQEFLHHPLDLNLADENGLASLQVLSALQIRELIRYRELLGPLVSIYELQAVPLWTPALIQKIRLYVTVSIQPERLPGLVHRFTSGQHSLLLRVSQVPERSKGYLADKSTAANFYPGSPQRLMVRYGYVYRQLLQFGILAEKDPGEQFFKGNQKKGFDFYSVHLFARHIGIISALALGDFTVNMGQGLVQWQSLAFKKSGEVLNCKRQGPILRPYNSAGEINFHRGFGITLTKRRWETTLFISRKKTDANLLTDSLGGGLDIVSSLQTSGYHRTNSETADRGVLRQLAFGGNLSYRSQRLQMGINAVQYRFNLPLVKSDEPYNTYALKGRVFSNLSFDYSYTLKNCHFFGELAVNDHLDKALLQGLLIAVSGNVEMSFLYRNISRSYQALNANAFTEYAIPSNEKGLYMGITVRPNSLWTFSAYADVFSFPWLKYRVDKPSAGTDLLIQADYKPGRQLEIYSRYHAENKPLNYNPEYQVLSPVVPISKQDWRTEFIYKPNRIFTLRNRTEMIWFDARGSLAEQGFLVNFDLLYNPVLKPFSGNLRLQYFETEGYNSRIYAYENDVLYNFSIPVFYDKGYRYYINFHYNINRKLSLWTRWSQTLYSGKSLIGSGLDEISGSKKSEIKVQALYKF